jgi:hypothetical protein
MTEMRLTDPQGTLLEEIADPAMRVKDVTLTYAFALLDQEAVDWPEVNKAIIGRWSVATLDRVKREAWKLYQQRRAGGGGG